MIQNGICSKVEVVLFSGDQCIVFELSRSDAMDLFGWRGKDCNVEIVKKGIVFLINSNCWVMNFGGDFDLSQSYVQYLWVYVCVIVIV